MRLLTNRCRCIISIAYKGQIREPGNNLCLIVIFNTTEGLLANGFVRPQFGSERGIVHFRWQFQHVQGTVENNPLDRRYPPIFLSFSIYSLYTFPCEFSYPIIFYSIIFLLCYCWSKDHQLVYWDASGGLSVYRAVANQSAVLVPGHVVVIRQTSSNSFDWLIKIWWQCAFPFVTKSRNGGLTSTGLVTTVATFYYGSSPMTHKTKASCCTPVVSDRIFTPSTTRLKSKFHSGFIKVSSCQHFPISIRRPFACIVVITPYRRVFDPYRSLLTNPNMHATVRPITWSP